MRKKKPTLQEEGETAEKGDFQPERKKESTTKKNLPPGWTRTTVTMQEKHLQKLKDLAWWGRASPKDVLSQILEKYFANKNVRPIPEKYEILDDD